MAITYDAPSNTITVTGYTEGTPCTFLDIYNADVGGGWGVVTAQCSNTQFCFNCKLVVGNDATQTWLADGNVQITFNDGIVTANSEYLIEGKRYAHIRFGEILVADTKSTGSGISFLSLESTYQFTRFVSTSNLSGSDCYLLSCSFSAPNKIHYVEPKNANDRTWHCQLMKNTLPFTADGDLYDIVVQDVYIGLYSVTTASERIWLGGNHTTAAMYARYTPATTVKNVEVAGAYTVLFSILSKTVNPIYAINVDAPTWSISWAGTSAVPLYRQYTFNLQVFDESGTAINGATVTLTTNAGTPAFSVSTAADGTIAEQTVSRGYYDQAHGSTLQDYGPFTLTITSGNLTYVHPQLVLDEPIDWRIALPSIRTVGARRIIKKTVEKLVPSPADPALLMTAGMLLVKTRSLKRQLHQRAIHCDTSMSSTS